MINKKIINKALKHFGTTDNPKLAGYLLPDGKFLDFSGKHWDPNNKFLGKQRTVDHRVVNEIGVDMNEFVIETHAIRWSVLEDSNGTYLYISFVPDISRIQYNKILEVYNDIRDLEIYVDIWNELGKTIDSFTISFFAHNSNSPLVRLDPYIGSTVLEFLRSYYNNDFEDSLRLLDVINEDLNLTTKQLDSIKHVMDIQGSPGNWDADSYNHGLYNGMQLIKSIIYDCEPKYKSWVKMEAKTSTFDIEVFEIAEKIWKETKNND